MSKTSVEKNKLNIAVIMNELENLKNSLDELKENTNKGFKKVFDQIDNFERKMTDKYATKNQVENLKDDVEGLIKLRDWVARIIVGTVIIALLGLVVTNANF